VHSKPTALLEYFNLGEGVGGLAARVVRRVSDLRSAGRQFESRPMDPRFRNCALDQHLQLAYKADRFGKVRVAGNGSLV
jgi:hypothetical protein